MNFFVKFAMMYINMITIFFLGRLLTNMLWNFKNVQKTKSDFGFNVDHQILLKFLCWLNDKII